NAVQIWAERGVLALAGYLLLLGLFLRECGLRWHGPARAWSQAGLAVIVGLTFAGLFEFNFGDTEVFYLTLDLMALIVAELELVGVREEERGFHAPVLTQAAG